MGANVTILSGSPTDSMPITLQFNCTTPGLTWWNWDLGDGNTSNQQNFTHDYYLAGNTTATLTAGNAAGNDSHIYFILLLMNPSMEIF